MKMRSSNFAATTEAGAVWAINWAKQHLANTNEANGSNPIENDLRKHKTIILTALGFIDRD